MKQPKPAFKKLLLLCAPIALTAVIIGSCKKDTHSSKQSVPTPPAVAEAKSWYEKTYPTNSKLSTQAAGSDLDLSQGIHPDWENGATYTRFDDDVVELPIDAATSAKLNIGIKEQTTGIEYQSANSKSSFLLIKKLGTYHAYIMTLIADPAYLKGDLTKLDNNKYNKRDSAFSGVVLYFTPKGTFVNAWTYQFGKITGKVSPNTASSGSASTNENTNKIKTNLTEVLTCYQWIQTTTYEGHSYPSVELSNYCVTTYTGSGISTGGGGSSSPPGTGDSGSGGGSTPPPAQNDPCAPKGGAIDDAVKIKINTVTVNQTPPPNGPVDPGSNPGGGFPPPDGNVPCATVVTGTTKTIPAPDIIDSLGAKYPCVGRLIASLPNLPTAVARLIYQAFESQTGHNIIFREGTTAYFAANPSEDGYTQTQSNTSRIYINPSVLANSSNEYQLVTLYHEALHAYLDAERGTLGDAGFATKYPAVKVVARPANASNVTRQYDYYFDEGAYYTKVDPKHRTMAEYFTQELRDAILAYNPSFPVDRATALARGGIFLNDLSNKAANDEEKDVRTGKSLGTKCTP